MEAATAASTAISPARFQSKGLVSGSKGAAFGDWADGSLRNVAFPKARCLAAAGAKAVAGKSRARRLVCAATTEPFNDDGAKITSLVARRVVYGPEDWRKHISTARHWRHIRTILTSKVIGALGPPVSVMTGIATGVVSWNLLVANHVLPDGFGLLHISNLPFSLTAPALSFLLVFRTNASYGRFDEARKQWGLMLNRTRDIARQALSYMARDEYTYEYPRRAQFLRHVQAFPLAYKHHFLQEGSLEGDLKQYTMLTDEEIAGVLAATHRPNYVLQMMSECMRSCHMNPIYRLAMEQNFQTFADDVGGSERLFKTPIPLSYTRLTSRFLVLYHMFLPFALWDPMGVLTIPVTVLCTAIFFCIEEVGVIIENPFPILALDVIAQSARNNISELISLHEGIRNRVVGDDEEMRLLSAMSQQAMLPSEPVYVPEPEPEYTSDWQEDAAAFIPSVQRVPIAARGPYFE